MNRKRGRVVFLVHPRDHRDIEEAYWWGRIVPPPIVDFFMKRLKGKMGYTICEKVDIYRKLDLYLVGINLKIHKLIGDKSLKSLKLVRSRIMESVMYSQQELGAGVIGLGALTASVTGGGSWLEKQKEVYATITNGGSVTAMIAEDGLREIIARSGIKHPRVAIVGTYGVIGTALSRMLCEEYPLIMMGRNRVRLERLYRSLQRKGTISTSMESLREADIVITVTNSPETFARAEYFKEGAIIYDIAQPPNVKRSLLEERPDIVRIDGAFVDIPGIDISFDMRTGRGRTFACLVETILIALEDMEGDFCGELKLDQIERFREVCRKYGFAHSPFTQYGEPLDYDKLAR